MKGLFSKKLVVNLALSATSLLVMAPICGELFLRIGIATGVEALRNPRLYAGWTDDDDCWKLRYRWREPGSDVWDGGLVFDPRLGWTMGEEAVGICEDCRDPVLLYGDSFVFGVHPVSANQRIPSQLRRFLPDRSVLNYAVSGYGFDQVFLRFQATHGSYENPTVVVGIMTLDLDRSIFSVRSAPKPYFRLRGGELELAGVPLEPDVDAWHRRHPPRIRSYLYAFLKRRYHLSRATAETEVLYRRDEKAALNARILEAMAREAAEHDLRLVVVLLYPPWELGFEGWRERFLLEHLERLGLPYIDTKPLLLERSDNPKEELYLRSPNNHPNGVGNRTISRAIAKHLRALERRAQRRGDRVG